MSVLFVGTSLNGATIQAGPFDAVKVKRLPNGSGLCQAADPKTAGFITIANHTPSGPWKFDGTLELEDFDIVTAAEGGPETAVVAVEEPEKKPRKKPGPKPGRRKKVQDATLTVQPEPVGASGDMQNSAQAALGLAADPIEQIIADAEADIEASKS